MSDRCLDGKPDRPAGDVGAIPDIVFQLLKITQKRTNPGHDRLAELCQHDATPGAIEELRLELALKDGAISVSAHSVALDSKCPQ